MTQVSNHPNRRTVLALAAGGMAWPVIGRAAPLAVINGEAFGTNWSVALDGRHDLPGLYDRIRLAFETIDRQMSPWRADSEVTRLNIGAPGRYAVSAGTAHVTAEALELSRLSDGAFDPAVGPLVSQWGFGPINGVASTSTGTVLVEGNDLIKPDLGLTLDLCGIAKGYALDGACAILRDAGVDAAIFDLGGELAALGRHPAGRAWQVGVEEPHGALDVAAKIALPDGHAVATSGTARQSYRLGDRIFSHIIDPGTGEPVNSRLVSVTVIARRAATADGWATALLAAGESNGPALAARFDLDALFLIDAGTGTTQVKTGRVAEFLL